MIRRIAHALPGIFPLAAALLLVFTGTAGAAEFWLRAETLTTLMPDGTQIPMWGYALDTDQNFSTFEGAPTVPGPHLTVPPGEALIVHLFNRNIPEGVSLIIPGQAAPTDSVNPPQVVRNLDGRARSFTHEVDQASQAVYAWTTIRPGTYLYHSGSHAAVQVQMGLYGSLEKDQSAGNAYGVAASDYDQDLTLVYSEIDPALHAAVAAGQYGPGLAMTSTIHHEPKYFFVNGSHHRPGRSSMTLGAPGSRTLLRFLNAGLQTHLPVLGGGPEFTLLGEDGNLSPFPRESYQVELPAGRTVDAIVVVPGPGYYPLYDRMLDLANGVAPGGGMLVSLAVPSAETYQLTVNRDGTGAGSVLMASLPGGISCGANCTEDINANTWVTLRGQPEPGSLLTGWSGVACSGPGDCVTNMWRDKTVTATFTSFSAVTVVLPNGGESIAENSLYTIRWGAPAAGRTFTLWYSTDNGTTWIEIDRGLTGNSYEWRVPAVSATLSTCRVGVRGANAARVGIGTDVSDAVFSIVDVP
jgi:FtsP/CotA-like multicopper oxidase with cupredoxin domain